MLEEEVDGTLAFLDVKLSSKPNGEIIRSVHRKKCWTGQYVHFHSSVPRSQKRNLVANLADRIRQICSPCMVQNELDKLKLTLKKNGYPEQFLNSNMRPITRQREQETTEVQKRKLYFMLPFGGDLPAEILMRRISRATKARLPDIQLRFIFGTRKLLRTNEKDSIPLMSKSLIVYLFTCACKLQYIGRSKRCLSSRIAQHLPQKLISRGASPSQKNSDQ